MTHRHIASFEDTVSVGAPDAMLETFARQKSVYSRSLALAPGSYRLNILAKDMSGGSVSAYEQRLIVPAAGEARIAASSIVLADAVETLPVKSIGAGQFAVGDTKVRPRMDNVFHAGERMRIFFKVYNFDADAGAAAPREIVFDVTRAGESVAHQITETSAAADVTVNKSLDLTAFAPGAYVLRVTVADKATGQTLVRSTPFTVSPPL